MLHPGGKTKRGWGQMTWFLQCLLRKPHQNAFSLRVINRNLCKIHNFLCPKMGKSQSKTLPKPIPIVLRHHQLTIGREKKQPDFEDKTINNGAIMLMIVYDGFSAFKNQNHHLGINTTASIHGTQVGTPKSAKWHCPKGGAPWFRHGVSNCIRKSWYFKWFI